MTCAGGFASTVHDSEKNPLEPSDAAFRRRTTTGLSEKQDFQQFK
jgi:hypothetical protein